MNESQNVKIDAKLYKKLRDYCAKEKFRMRDYVNDVLEADILKKGNYETRTK